MLRHASSALFSLILLTHGCSDTPPPVHLKYKATGASPEVLALYEAWFGFSKHISVGYSSHDPAVIRRQIQEARSLGISGFVVDWYGDREPFIDKSYALMQTTAAEQNFHVAMMYDETDQEDGATDEAIADFTMFRDTYLSSTAPGHQAYLTYQGHPVIFVFPKGKHTNWDKVKAVIDKWNPSPLLINENLPGEYSKAFDGYYAWINPGPKGWSSDGSNWGADYLADFYQTMATKYPDKMIIAGAWSQFDDTKASWSLNRHMAARCGQTFKDTFNDWRRYIPADQPIPFIMVETWNDYEEGSAIERGITPCGNGAQQQGQGNHAALATTPASNTQN
jgi:hypothetical protein